MNTVRIGIKLQVVSPEITQDCRGRLPGHPYSWSLISAALEGITGLEVPGRILEDHRDIPAGCQDDHNVRKYLA